MITEKHKIKLTERFKKEREHFDTLAEKTGDTWWGNTTPAGIKRMQRRAHLLKLKLSHTKDPHVLEIGCGTGSFSKHVLELLPSLNLTACDLSPKSIKISTSICAKYKHTKFEVADCTSLPYPKNIFDAVIGNSILHHLPIEKSLKECFRVLKPNGIIFFSEPNMMNPQVFLERNIRFIGKILQNTENETAFFRWSLAKTLHKIGLQDISIQPFCFLHPLVPKSLISIIDKLGQLFEKIPIIKETSGSLLIIASKPNT